MDRCLYFLFLACLLQLSIQDGSLKAAVVEYNPYLYTPSNLHMYKYLIEKVKDPLNAKIVIFPESTLTMTKEFASLVPRPEDDVKPHLDPKYMNHKIMREISEVAKNKQMYVVINLLERENCSGNNPCPPRGYFLYNTNVAFDRTGKVVARYRKINVYDKDEIDEPKSKELSTFEIDGVKFGMFTCFDILFKTPAIDLVDNGVKNLIFTSRWHGELPFLTAVQIQGGWSYAHNVSFLAAGANKPGEGSSGTGIYWGKFNNVRGKHVNRVTGTEQTFLLMHDVLSAPASIQNESVPFASSGLHYLADPTVELASKKVLDSNFNGDIGGCKFNVQFKQISNMASKYTYQAVAFQGKRKFGKNADLEVFYCAVLLCTNGNCTVKPSDSSFERGFDGIEITTPDMSGQDILVMPSTLKLVGNGEEPNILDHEQFTFRQKGPKIWAMELKKDKYDGKGIMTFGIFGRIFAG